MNNNGTGWVTCLYSKGNMGEMITLSFISLQALVSIELIIGTGHVEKIAKSTAFGDE